MSPTVLACWRHASSTNSQVAPSNYLVGWTISGPLCFSPSLPSPSLPLSLSLSLSLALSLSLSLSLCPSFPPLLSLSLSLPLALSHSLTLSHSLSLSFTHSLTHSPSLSVCLSLSLYNPCVCVMCTDVHPRQAWMSKCQIGRRYHELGAVYLAEQIYDICSVQVSAKASHMQAAIKALQLWCASDKTVCLTACMGLLPHVRAV